MTDIEAEPVIVEIWGGWAAVGNGWAVFARLEAQARDKYVRALQLHREIAARDYPSVWSDDLPPGGWVCGKCGQPTESEPCAEHQPLAAAGGESPRTLDDSYPLTHSRYMTHMQDRDGDCRSCYRKWSEHTIEERSLR